MHSLREMMHSLRASPVFALSVLATLGLAGVIGLMVLLMQLQPGFMGMAHGTEPQHRIHDLTYGCLFTTAVVGMLAQLRRPWKNVAGMLMALIPWVGLLLAGVLAPPALLVAPLTLIAALLHPTGRNFFRSFRVSRVNWMMLALVIIAVVPLLAYASTNIRLQATIPDDHARMGHYGFMAAFGFTVIAAGVLASLRPDGWRLTAWVAGLLPAVLGVASLVFPASSSFSLVWAFAGIVWGVGFVAVAELTKKAGLPADDSDLGPDRGSTAGTSPWQKVLAGIALVVVLGLIMVRSMLFSGGGHGPGGGPRGRGPGGHGSGLTPSIDGAPALAITATNKLAFDPDRIELTAGMPVNVALTSADIQHDLVVDEIGFHLAADSGETVIGGLVFDKPGTYVGYCSVPGHRNAGMELVLVVKPSGGGH